MYMKFLQSDHKWLTFVYFQVRTDFTQIDATHFAITICDADNMNHIAVFLTGTIPFPDGTAGLGKWRLLLHDIPASINVNYIDCVFSVHKLVRNRYER